MADTVDGEVRAITGRVEKMDIREKEHRLPGKVLLEKQYGFHIAKLIPKFLQEKLI